MLDVHIMSKLEAMPVEETLALRKFLKERKMLSVKLIMMLICRM